MKDDCLIGKNIHSIYPNHFLNISTLMGYGIGVCMYGVCMIVLRVVVGSMLVKHNTYKSYAGRLPYLPM
jgi:hypothetical protein